MIRPDRSFVETPSAITKPQTVTPFVQPTSKEISKDPVISDKKEVGSFLSSTDSVCSIKFEPKQSKEPKDLKQALDIAKEASKLTVYPGNFEKKDDLEKQFGEAIKNLSPDDLNKLKSELSKIEKSDINSIGSFGVKNLSDKVDNKIKLKSMSSSDIVKEFSKLTFSPLGMERAKELKEEFAIRVPKMPHSEMLELRSELQKDLNSMYEKKTVTFNGQTFEEDSSMGRIDPQQLIDVIKKRTMSELESLKDLKLLER